MRTPRIERRWRNQLEALKKEYQGLNQKSERKAKIAAQAVKLVNRINSRRDGMARRRAA